MKIKLTSILLLITLCLTSCDFTFDGNSGELHNEATKLSAPMNIRVDENNVVHWSEVPNATSYIIQIGDETHQATTTELQYPISAMYSESKSDLYIKVKAKAGQSLLYSDSDWSIMYGPINYVASSEHVSGEIIGTAQNSNNQDVNIFKFSPTAVLFDITNSNNYTSFTNGEYNYYVFHIGRIRNVALEDAIPDQFIGGEKTLEFTTSTVSYNSLKNAAERTVTSSSSFSLEFSQELKFVDVIEIGLSSTQKFEFSDTNTLSSSYEKIVSNEVAQTKKESHTLNENSPLGNYLYVLIGNIDVYNTVIVNKTTSEIQTYTFTTVSAADRRLVYLGDDITYPTQSDVTLNFNIDDVKDIIQQEPTTVISNTALESSTITIDLIPQNCVDNNNYDTSSPETNEIAKNEIDPDIIDMLVFGCITNTDGEYVIVDKDDFDIGLKFLQSYDNIELTGYPGSEQSFKANISDDSWKGALGTNINDEIDRGTYWVKVHYKNGKTDSGYSCKNFMEGKYKDDTISILAEHDFINGDVEDIAKIDIIIIYEIEVHWYGTAGYHDCWSAFAYAWHTYTNWRYDYTIIFAD